MGLKVRPGTSARNSQPIDKVGIALCGVSGAREELGDHGYLGAPAGQTPSDHHKLVKGKLAKKGTQFFYWNPADEKAEENEQA